MGIIINGQNDTIGPVDNSMSLLGTVSIGGTMTIEDFTNIDSVGLVTARNGVNVTAGDVNLTSGNLALASATPMVVASNGSGSLRLGAGGSEKVRITSAGNVGINSTIPDHKLEVAYTSDDDGFVINHANRGGKWKFATSGSTAELFDIRRYDGANSTFRRYLLFGPDQFSVYTGSTTSATERLRITSGGNIGIGTASPTHSLASFGSGNSGGVRIENTHDTTTVSGNTASGAFPHNLVLSNYESQNAGSANRMASLGFDIPTPGGSHANATIAYQATNTSGNGDLQFWIEENNTPKERLRIASNGNIGVNNNAPLHPLHFKNAMSSSPSFIRMEVTGTNTVGGGGGISFDTSASNTVDGLYLAEISAERSSSDNGSNSLIFKTTLAAANGDGGVLHGPKTRMTIDENGNLILGDFATVDTRNTGGLHIQHSKGVSFRSNTSQSVSRNWRIRNDDYGWGNLDFSVGDTVSDWGDSAGDVLLSLTSNRRVGINATVPQQRLDVVGLGFTSAVFRPDTSSASVYGNTGSVNDLIQLRMPYGASASNTSNSGARWGIKFQGRNDGAGYTNDDKSASIYAVSEDSLGYNRRVGLAFYTSSFDADQVERLRISNTGTIIKGSTNSANSQQPVQLFFNKRGSQIGRRVHHGSGSSSTTHNLFTISSWQSSNTRLFAYVTVHYVNPVSNFGGRMETYAAANYGGTRAVGTFTVADGGRWGNPSGTLSLSWSGNVLQLNTFNNAYMEYSVDITYVAYDGAVVVFS